jgi:hypothetical protein
VVESDRPVNVLPPDELGNDAQPGNLVSIGDQRWREYPVARGGRALGLVSGDGTVCIIAAAPAGDLRVLAGHLR